MLPGNRNCHITAGSEQKKAANPEVIRKAPEILAHLLQSLHRSYCFAVVSVKGRAATEEVAVAGEQEQLQSVAGRAGIVQHPS